MARLDRMPAAERAHLLALPCPSYPGTPWVPGRPLAERRVAIVSTAGLHRRADRPFGPGAGDYRVIPGDTPAADLTMSHISSNFDRTGFVQDAEVVFPLTRLRELAAEGVVGSVAAYHYSFMGATDPRQLEGAARRLAPLLAADGVDGALLVPV